MSLEAIWVPVGCYTGSVIQAVTCLIFYTIYAASQFAGAGKILRQTFGLPIIYSMIIAATIIIYSVTGGFMSVVWTDVIRALLMIITLCVTPIIGIYALRTNGLTLMGALNTNGMLNPFGNAKGIGIALLPGTLAEYSDTLVGSPIFL